MFSIAIVVGTRPEIIKMAPIILEAKNRGIQLLIIHTGQHYDKEMSDQFFDSLNLPIPSTNLNVKSEFADEQLSIMINKLGETLRHNQSDIVLALGDTISVLATCLACVQNKKPFGHIEAGLRSYDDTMPEEINRKMIDSVSTLLFAPSERAEMNLRYEGVSSDRIFNTGNTIVDAIKIFGEIILENETNQVQEIIEKIPNSFILATIHREVNVENKENLKEIINAIDEYEGLPIVFLLHPRTRKKLEEYGWLDDFTALHNVFIYPSINYISMLQLLKNEKCKMIITDSGGLQEEAAVLKIPCLTIRRNTERPETVESGVNILVPPKKELILLGLTNILSDEEFKMKFELFKMPYGDGFASNKILDIIEERIGKLSFVSPESYKYGSKSFFLSEIKRDTKRTIIEDNFNCSISMVYDEKGQPIPIPDTLKKGYRVRVCIN